jgi:hypothetical protein
VVKFKTKKRKGKIVEEKSGGSKGKIDAPATIALLEHHAALLRSLAARAVGAARSLQRITSICRSQLDDVDRTTSELRTMMLSESESCPAVPPGGLLSVEQRLGLARNVVVHLREAQLQFSQSVIQLDCLYQKIGPEAPKLLIDLDRSASGEVAWYAESWEVVLRRWEAMNLSVALVLKKRSVQSTDASSLAAQKLCLNSLYGKMGRGTFERCQVATK